MSSIARLYLIAHAPAEPWHFFDPKMPPEPSRVLEWKYCEPCKGDYDECTGQADCDKLRAFNKAHNIWNSERDRERLIQWPAYWADQMLAQIGRETQSRKDDSAPTQKQDAGAV